MIQIHTLLLFKGAKIVYDVKKPVGERVVSVEILDFDGIVPQYRPMDMNRYYKCSGMEYLADGGDGFTMIPKYRKNHK